MSEISQAAFMKAVTSADASVLEPCSVVIDGVPVPLRLMRRASRPGGSLVILFHGSVNRAIVPIPAFEGGFLAQSTALDATVVSIGDPLLARAPDLRAAWYAGAHDQDTRALVRSLIDGLQDATSSGRLVLAGGSTGGHPALVHASERPDSVAVVVNPIVNIGAYHPDYVQGYRATCWPDVAPGDPLPGVPEDLRSLYGEPGNNTVIYLQNARDGHFWRQAVPFLGALRGMKRLQSVMFIASHFDDHPGHTFPPQEWARWIVGACTAADPTPPAVAAAASAQASRLPAAAGLAGKGKSNVVSAHDLGLARRLAAWQLDPHRS